MAVLQERGRFWWHEEPIPAGYFAPESALTGLLTIEPGRIALELDGILSTDERPFEAISARQGETVPDKLIQGILSLTGKRVLLAGVIKNGGQIRSNGPSNQNFLALDCLLGEEPFPAGEPPVIDSMTVHLKGLEGWLRLGSVKVSKTKNTITARYKRPQKATYKFDNAAYHSMSGHCWFIRQSSRNSSKNRKRFLDYWAICSFFLLDLSSRLIGRN
jgi:hypothetical protein